MTENVTEQHRALKAVVIVLGALIVICLGIIATTVAKRMAAPEHDVPLPLPQDPQPGHPVFFGDVPVIIPEGARVVQMSTSGDRLLLLLESNRGGRQIHAADARSGAYLGTYHLTPGDRPGS
jgi:hypothetical protein